ncbi:MAG TPA: zinc-binding dehydrogenase [Chloroflexota bacterium]|nr:zinc-binding dehydrogenase [Chloroflexota bacterium]
MKAARLYGPRDLRVETIPDPRPGPGEALIRILACGVCPSDLRSYLGSRPVPTPSGAGPRTPGHEWAGEIVALGDETEETEGAPAQGAPPEGEPRLEVGDRVVADPRYVCGRCYQCRRGVFNYCERLQRIVRGGFAEYGVSPLSQLRRLPDHVSYEEASFCEPLACVVNGNEMTPMRLGDDVVIVGAGPIGLMHLQLARARGARLISSDPLPERLEAARALGAHDLVQPGPEDAVARVKELTEGRGADAVVVAVSSAEAVRQGLQMAAIHGTVNAFAGIAPAAEFPFDPNLVHYREMGLTGSHDYIPHHFSVALKLLSLGIVRVAPLISHRFDLGAVQEAFELAAGRGGLKAMVLPAG